MAGMGLGALAGKSLCFKRKFRWKFAVPGKLPDTYVKTANRPTLTITPAEVHYLNQMMEVPGKGKWSNLTVTYYDVEDAGFEQQLRAYISSTFPINANSVDNMCQQDKLNQYATYGLLKMLDGCGSILETWTLYDLWPISVNWGDLDYSSSDVATIEVTFSFRHAEVS